MVSKNRLNQPIVILTGPTASGKSEKALDLACLQDRFEIINADSLLVFKGLDIGTAKPSPDDQKKIPHHLIDIRNPDQSFTAGDFFRASEAAVTEILSKQKIPLFVGGSGFYLKSLLFGLWDASPSDPVIKASLEQKSNEELYQLLVEKDPGLKSRVNRNDRYRLIRFLELFESTKQSPQTLQAQLNEKPDLRYHVWILDRSTEELNDRILMRTKKMIGDGLIEEVEALRRQYPDCRPLQSVGYAQVVAYLDKITPKGRKMKPGVEGLIEEIALATRQLVKSQRTWLRGQLKNVTQVRSFILDSDQFLIDESFKNLYNF